MAAKRHSDEAIAELSLIELGAANSDFRGASGYWSDLRNQPHTPGCYDFAVESLCRRMPEHRADALRKWHKKWNGS